MSSTYPATKGRTTPALPVPRDREGQIYEYPTAGGARYGFIIDIGIPGGERQQVRRQGFRTRKVARQERDRLLLEQDNGLYIKRPRMPFVDYMSEWLDGREAIGDLRPATVKRYRDDLKRLRRHRVGAAPLVELQARHLDGFYRDLLAKGGTGQRPLSPTTVRHLHTVVHKALDDAVRQELLVRNPADGGHCASSSCPPW